MKPALRTPLPFAAALAALMLGACLSGNDDEPRPYVYRNDVSGYSLTFPVGWFIEKEPLEGAFDFSAFKVHGGFVRGEFWRMLDSAETVDAWVELEYADTGVFVDSFRILPKQTRMGVHVVPVDEWFSVIADSGTDSSVTLRWQTRTLYAKRGGKLLELAFQGLYDDTVSVEANPHLRAVDSSLTFF